MPIFSVPLSVYLYFCIPIMMPSNRKHVRNVSQLAPYKPQKLLPSAITRHSRWSLIIPHISGHCFSMNREYFYGLYTIEVSI